MSGFGNRQTSHLILADRSEKFNKTESGEPPNRFFGGPIVRMRENSKGSSYFSRFPKNGFPPHPILGAPSYSRPARRVGRGSSHNEKSPEISGLSCETEVFQGR